MPRGKKKQVKVRRCSDCNVVIKVFYINNVKENAQKPAVKEVKKFCSECKTKQGSKISDEKK